jgi:mRNA-degrading endonuclease toxin of MazEF toxin-antitoxin module
VARFHFGQVLWAYVNDGQGHVKEHPVVIIGSDADCGSGGPLQVVVISTKISDPRPDFHILVHHDNSLNSRTGLYEPCVAKCNWVQDVARDRVIEAIGNMPDELLDPIILAVNQLINDPTFTQWIAPDFFS